MKKCHCAIIEDEPIAQKILMSYIRRHEDLELVGVYSSAIKALEGLRSNRAELLFLDIHLPHLNGLDFISSIKEPPAVIFTTANPEYGAASYDLDAVDYLLKPITFERFSLAIGKHFKKQHSLSHHQGAGFFFIKEGNMFKKIYLSEILWIEALKDYLRIHMSAGTVVTHMTMKSIEVKLQGLSFVRIHRSYLVSLHRIESVSGSSVRIAATELPIGDKYRHEALSAIRRALESPR